MAQRQRASRAPGRRKLLGSALALGALGTLVLGRTRAESGLPGDARALRPPGALPEARFLSACVRCGQCVQACPYHTLHLADDGGPVQPGTPYFLARRVPCFLCADLPCQRACPTGALGPPAMRTADTRIGLAQLSRPEGCYSFIGAAACTACWKACPLRERAITMKRGATRLGGRFTPTVNADVCTGCGLCEKHCIADPPAITVAALGRAPDAARG